MGGSILQKVSVTAGDDGPTAYPEIIVFSRINVSRGVEIWTLSRCIPGVRPPADGAVTTTRLCA